MYNRQYTKHLSCRRELWQKPKFLLDVRILRMISMTKLISYREIFLPVSWRNGLVPKLNYNLAKKMWVSRVFSCPSNDIFFMISFAYLTQCRFTSCSQPHTVGFCYAKLILRWFWIDIKVIRDFTLFTVGCQFSFTLLHAKLSTLKTYWI